VLEDGPDRWGHLADADRRARERVELPFTVLVNPSYEVAGEGARVSFYEGCLSVPGLTGLVSRYQRIRVSALDEHGEALERILAGWPARIAQHEIDHLAGVLYLDKVDSRSLSTSENFARLWAGLPLAEVTRELGLVGD
jgi:peptide deformylase